MTFTIHGTAGSPFVRKTLIAFEEKGVPYKRTEIAPLPKTEELLAMNPLGKIPVLEHNGEFIPDSSVICAYLEKTEPGPPLFPSDPVEFARALLLEEAADTLIVGAIGGIFFQNFVRPNFFGEQPDTDVVNRLVAEELPRAYGFLEQQLEAGAATLLDSFSVADAAMAGQLSSLLLIGMEIDVSAYPKTAHYFQQLVGRPSVQAALAHLPRPVEAAS